MNALEQELFERVDQARRRHRVPALGAAIVTHERTPLVAVAGHRIRGHDSPVARGDRWHIGSCGRRRLLVATAYLAADLLATSSRSSAVTVPCSSPTPGTPSRR